MTTTDERIPPHREIITDQFPPEGSYVRAIDVIPAAGDVDRVYTIAEAVALTRAEHDRLDALIEGLRCLVGFRRMDALLSGVNAFENALRNETIARLVGAAADVRDWRIDAFIVPEPEGARVDEGGDDATPVR